jgi:uncharacterized protein (TIGR01777 family)
MRTLISGATGLVGSALVESLHVKGHNIRCLQRDKNPGNLNIWNTDELFTPGNEESFDTVIHLAGENVAEGRWSNARKRRIMDSRVEGTRQLVEYLSTLKTPPSTFICASAIGFYGNRGNELLSEKSHPGNGFLAEVCRKWEAESEKATTFGARVVKLRFGMILSPKGGALHKMLPAFKAGLGGPIGKGRQYMSWVSIRDLVEIVDFVINAETIGGAVNVVAPEAITNKGFTEILAKSLHKPAKLPAPPFALRLLLGEMADELLLASNRVIPAKLLAAGYCFQDADLAETLKYCLRE